METATIDCRSYSPLHNLKYAHKCGFGPPSVACLSESAPGGIFAITATSSPRRAVQCAATSGVSSVSRPTRARRHLTFSADSAEARHGHEGLERRRVPQVHDVRGPLAGRRLLDTQPSSSPRGPMHVSERKRPLLLPLSISTRKASKLATSELAQSRRIGAEMDANGRTGGLDSRMERRAALLGATEFVNVGFALEADDAGNRRRIGAPSCDENLPVMVDWTA
jgi:hypothetical protein